MRSLFLVLVLANALLVAVQFESVRTLLGMDQRPLRQSPLNAERLRVIRDTSATARPAAPPPAQNPQAPAPANSSPG